LTAIRHQTSQTRLRRVGCASAVCIAAALAIASPAPAATTVGSNLLGKANVSIACGLAGQPNSICTVGQTTMPDRPTVSSVDGVIVRWRIRSASGGTVRLRVIRPAGGGQFEGAGTSDAGQLTSASSPGQDQTYTFNTRLPVQQGDFIGLDRQRRVGAIYHGRSGQGGYGLIRFDSPLPNGDSRGPDGESSGAELLLNADIEPDQDADGFGDQTQDNCPSIPNDQKTNPCPSTAVNDGSGDDSGSSDEGPRVFRRHKHKHHHRPKRRGKHSSADHFRHH
jgi:hypothetical protein